MDEWAHLCFTSNRRSCVYLMAKHSRHNFLVPKMSDVNCCALRTTREWLSLELMSRRLTMSVSYFLPSLYFHEKNVRRNRNGVCLKPTTWHVCFIVHEATEEFASQIVNFFRAHFWCLSRKLCFVERHQNVPQRNCTVKQNRTEQS